MRKRVLTYSLALAMAVAMAVPQTAILPTGIVQVKAADTENGLKTGVALTKAEWGQNWSGTENYIKFTEMDKYASTSSDYCSKINKVVVNDKEYPVYDEEGKDNYYSMTYSDGLCIYMGSIKDGENTIIVSANGYKDKKIIVNVDKTATTVTFVSQKDLGSGDAVIDKSALNNMITAAKAYTKESASDEKWNAFQEAIKTAEDKEVLKAVKDAVEKQIIEPILVGDCDKIKLISEKINFDLTGIEILNSNNIEESAKIAVELVATKNADFVMKGILDTSILLKSVLNKEYGLRTESLLSHVVAYQMENYHKLLLITDGGMNISPNYEQKEMILKNAIQAAKALGIDTIKVACLAAKEKVNPKMQATVDGHLLQEASINGKFGRNVIVEGPLSFDIALSKEASDMKGFKSEVSGDIDILLVPNIEVGNGIGKSFTYMANAKSAGVIMGAKAPIVLVSRSDSAESKLYSIAYGALIAKDIKKII